MNCFVCAKEERTSAAVAVCAVCGMGLCMEHAHERTVARERHPSGWGEFQTPTTTMYIFCERCAKERAEAV